MNDRRGVEKLTTTLSEHVEKKIVEVRTKMAGAYSKADGEKEKKKTGKTRKNVDSEGEEIEDHAQVGASWNIFIIRLTWAKNNRPIF